MTNVLEQSEVVEDCPSYILKIKSLFNEKTKRVAIFTHPTPDPDAIGSMMGMSWLLRRAYNCDVSCFYSGEISHPQNKAMVTLLDPNLRNIAEYDAQHFDLNVLVDTVPSHAGIGEHKVNFNLVVDHHNEILNGEFPGVSINLRAGSACATVFNIIECMGYSFEEDNDHDARVATALMVGIATDTDYQMSIDSTQYECDAWAKLTPLKTPFLSQIVNYSRPIAWVKKEANATSEAQIIEGIGVVGMGILSESHRDMISDMAGFMSTWENVNTAIAFAVVGGNRIEGSVRSKNASVSVPALCKHLGGKHGEGGGKLGKGAYRYYLAGDSVEEEWDEETRKNFWEFQKDKEMKRILRIIQK